VHQLVIKRFQNSRRLWRGWNNRRDVFGCSQGLRQRTVNDEYL